MANDYCALKGYMWHHNSLRSIICGINLVPDDSNLRNGIISPLSRLSRWNNKSSWDKRTNEMIKWNRFEKLTIIYNYYSGFLLVLIQVTLPMRILGGVNFTVLDISLIYPKIKSIYIWSLERVRFFNAAFDQFMNCDLWSTISFLNEKHKSVCCRCQFEITMLTNNHWQMSALPLTRPTQGVNRIYDLLASFWWDNGDDYFVSIVFHDLMAS